VFDVGAGAVEAHLEAVAGNEDYSLDTSVIAVLVSGAGTWVLADCCTGGDLPSHLPEGDQSCLIFVQASEHGGSLEAAFAA
jgi:hypothetical protein